MLVPNTVALAVGTTATSTANRILAANSNLNRFIRGIYATNTTAASIALNVGVGAAATLSASNADVCFGFSVPANANSFPIVQYAGKGRRAVGSGSVNEIMAFAAATGLILTVVYEDDLLT